MKKIVSLFSGVGGLDRPFVEQGYEIAFANDLDADAVRIYDQNFEGKAKAILKDITTISLDSIPKACGLVAGFPCQPFSVAGRRRGFHDERGILFFNVRDIIKHSDPDFFLLENVKGLATHQKGETLKLIIQSLEEIGYFVNFKIMNSKDYGNIPQSRERIYIVGFKNKDHFNRFSYPEKIPLTKKINEVLDFNKKVDEKYYYTSQRNPKIFSLLEEKAKAKKNTTVYQYRRTHVRENKNNLCPTLTANMGMGGHNVPIIKTKFGYRKLTPRECFDLQGFPPDFNFEGLSDSSAYIRAGNSVCVDVIRRIVEKISMVFNQD